MKMKIIFGLFFCVIIFIATCKPKQNDHVQTPSEYWAEKDSLEKHVQDSFKQDSIRKDSIAVKSDLVPSGTEKK